MDKKQFKKEVDFLLKEAHQTLVSKNSKYANDDALHNFKAGAEISGKTPAETCWGYMTKHLTALRDMLTKENVDEDDLLEKCQDSINYVIFMYCLLKEQKVGEHFYADDTFYGTLKKDSSHVEEVRGND